MTLDRLELQLDDKFDYGEVYVALSRVTSLRGLWIKGKAKEKIVEAHPDVIKFHTMHRPTYDCTSNFAGCFDSDFLHSE